MNETKEHLDNLIRRIEDSKQIVDDIFIASNNQNLRSGLEGLVKDKLTTHFINQRLIGSNPRPYAEKELNKALGQEQASAEIVKDVLLGPNRETPMPDKTSGGKSRRKNRKKHRKTKKSYK